MTLRHTSAPRAMSLLKADGGGRPARQGRSAIAQAAAPAITRIRTNFRSQSGNHPTSRSSRSLMNGRLGELISLQQEYRLGADHGVIRPWPWA